MGEHENDPLKDLGWLDDPEGAEQASLPDERPDLVDALRHGFGTGERQGNGNGTGEAGHAHPAMGSDPGGADATLGGYMQVHDRPPAFEGSDGEPYSVGIDVEETDDPERPYAAFLVFLRWAASGAGIMGHVESEDVAFGETEEEARRAALELSLFEVRSRLDAAIARRRDAEA